MLKYFRSKKHREIEAKLKPFAKIFDDEFRTRDQKLEELVYLLETSNLDSEQLNYYKNKIDELIKTKTIDKDIKEFDDVINKDKDSRLEMIEDFEFLLNTSDFNSEDALKYLRKNKSKFILNITIGIFFMILGLGMIILPAPKYFEMFTIFWINTEDGITLMDIIAGIIVLSGIWIILNSSNKFSSKY
ncbi:MAG TPA: hypothetical protein PLG90_07860 [Ignavibacteria bacterium]|nr:hypothetical protein [Ignavibacteria bacterium]